jgi:putative flippase GtrA
VDTSDAPWWRSRLVGYLASGGGSMLLDVATLVFLRSGLGVALPLATGVAYLAGLLSNFLLNRYLVFSSSQSAASSGLRYLTLVVFNYAMTVLVVTGLSAVGVPYLIGKGIAVGLTLVWNFLAYRHWVFPESAGPVNQR